MNISDILSPDCVVAAEHVSSKKKALETIANLMASQNPVLTGEEIFDSLVAREKLGSTGIGHGVAIPHGRASTEGRSLGAFIRLDEGIDFDSIDGKPVRLVFGLLVPENSTEEHLQILGNLAALFSDESMCEKLEKAVSSDELYRLLTEWQAPAG